MKSRRSNLFADARRRRRRLEERVGPLEFSFEDNRPQVLEACLGWKSDQYVASGFPDAFRTGAHADFFRRLAGAGLLRVASLSAGGRLLATHLGALEAGRFYYWIPAYDPELTFFSPGRLLLDFMLKESQARGGEFDFLIGDEDYKWHYATHVRVVEPAGRPPLRLRALRGARSLARRVRSASPLADALTRRLRLVWLRRVRKIRRWRRSDLTVEIRIPATMSRGERRPSMGKRGTTLPGTRSSGR